MAISNGSFHCGIAAVQRPTAARADDELSVHPSCLSLISPGCTFPPAPFFSPALACENQPLSLLSLLF